MSDIVEVYEKLRVKTLRTDPGRTVFVAPEAQALAAMAAGEKLIVRRSFDSNGRQFRPGDVFEYKDWPSGRVATLAMAPNIFIVPEKTWRAGQAARELKDELNKVEPLHSALLLARQQTVKAKSLIPIAEAALAQAKDRVFVCESNEAKCTADLTEALRGPVVDKLLSE